MKAEKTCLPGRMNGNLSTKRLTTQLIFFVCVCLKAHSQEQLAIIPRKCCFAILKTNTFTNVRYGNVRKMYHMLEINSDHLFKKKKLQTGPLTDTDWMQEIILSKPDTLFMVSAQFFFIYRLFKDTSKHFREKNNN